MKSFGEKAAEIRWSNGGGSGSTLYRLGDKQGKTVESYLSRTRYRRGHSSVAFRR